MTENQMWRVTWRTFKIKVHKISILSDKKNVWYIMTLIGKKAEIVYDSENAANEAFKNLEQNNLHGHWQSEPGVFPLDVERIGLTH